MSETKGCDYRGLECAGIGKLVRGKWYCSRHMPPEPRIAAADEMAKALEAFVEAWDKSHQLEKTDVARRMAITALAAWNALK